MDTRRLNLPHNIEPVEEDPNEENYDSDSKEDIGNF